MSPWLTDSVTNWVCPPPVSPPVTDAAEAISDKFPPLLKDADWQKTAQGLKGDVASITGTTKPRFQFLMTRGRPHVSLLAVFGLFLFYYRPYFRQERLVLLLPLEKPCRKRSWIYQKMQYQRMGRLTLMPNRKGESPFLNHTQHTFHRIQFHCAFTVHWSLLFVQPWANVCNFSVYFVLIYLYIII